VATLATAFTLAIATHPSARGRGDDPRDRDDDRDRDIRHVLVISIDGMHALDFANCATGMPGVNGGTPYCPALVELATHGVNYLEASSSKPSDSYPGIIAQFTGGSPRSTGVFYDVSYDRTLSPPKAALTPNGIPGGANLCPGTKGTQVGFEEEIDADLTKLDGGGGINPDFLPRDPANGCAPVYPHSYLRVNTVFEVVKARGGYTAWTDKHLAYEILKGPSGLGLDDFFGPEINSRPVPLPQVPGCSPLPDQTAVTPDDDWTTSFENIKCYDALKVQSILNEIDGHRHDGLGHAPVPMVFGMNFQAVSVGQKLNEHKTDVGGYTDSLGTPTAHLLSEIRFVDASIARMIDALKRHSLFESTLIIVSAKHGQSPIDPKRLVRITGDNATDISPGTLLSPVAVGPGQPVAGSVEDDISLLWLSDQSQTEAYVDKLEANEALIGGGEIFSGKSLRLLFNDPLIDPRTPDIIVAPNVGVVYTGGVKKVSEHGGFAHDDTNVMLLVSNPHLARTRVTSPVETLQIAPTILRMLGFDPNELQAVRLEHTAVLPAVQ
jgi:hypothetical protein